MPTTYMDWPIKLAGIHYKHSLSAADAHEHFHDETREVHFAAEKLKLDKYFDTLKERPDLGISLNDGHSDGSGI